MKLLLEYNEKKSFIHMLDPRVKLFWLLGNLLLIIFFQDIRMLTLSFGMIMITTVLAGINPRVFLPMVKVMIVVGTQYIIFQGLLRPEGEILFNVLGLNFYAGGMIIGIRGIFLLLNLAFLFLQFVMWTSPQEIALLSVKSGLPDKYAVLMGMALHFLPVIERDLHSIYESQQARGLKLDTLWQKAKGLPPIMLPLILRALKRTQQVALSMELKGYGLHKTRTLINNIAFSKKDYLIFTLLILYFSVFIGCKIL
ncbi:energy-coupling factor transporter transmembrane protein EcfT [Oxobacter pfennigii]|uniref:Energy-coupling factor transporter transmembrane protein EcfT n=1 Tax=Oxobacter pfennigii TaxID=36849 RepID=A0A0P8WL54_9CLOT|nr:energy-coupling factor transporter transmembrane component T [Oxobacter pfennigii]KPU43116.1 energy-coupling factor transporter transmembrane protein EcfT [Oxobacter pfennigii]